MVPIWIQPGTFPAVVVDDASKPLVMIGPGTGIAPMRAILQRRRHLRRLRSGESGGGEKGEGEEDDDDDDDDDDWLYFGCRHRDKDFLFGDELLDMANAALPPPLPSSPSGGPTFTPSPIPKSAPSALSAPPSSSSSSSSSATALQLRVAFSRDERADGAAHGAEEHGARLYVTHRLREAPNAAALWDAVARRGAAVFVAGSAGQMPKDVNAALKHAAMAHGQLSAPQAEEFLRKLERRRRLCVEAYG